MEPTSDKIEISQHQTRNWILVGVCAFLLLLVQGLYTFAINSTGTEMRETNRNLLELLTTVKVQGAQIEDLKQNGKDEQAAHKIYDARLNSLEQRAALHDQWIQAHNH